MKQKYTLSIADLQISVISDAPAEEVEKVGMILDRKMREIYLKSRCPKTEAALLCALECVAERIGLTERTAELEDKCVKYGVVLEGLKDRNAELTAELERMRNENSVLRSLLTQNGGGELVVNVLDPVGQLLQSLLGVGAFLSGSPGTCTGDRGGIRNRIGGAGRLGGCGITLGKLILNGLQKLSIEAAACGRLGTAQTSLDDIAGGLQNALQNHFRGNLRKIVLLSIGTCLTQNILHINVVHEGVALAVVDVGQQTVFAALQIQTGIGEHLQKLLIRFLDDAYQKPLSGNGAICTDADTTGFLDQSIQQTAVVNLSHVPLSFTHNSLSGENRYLDYMGFPVLCQ